MERIRGLEQEQQRTEQGQYKSLKRKGIKDMKWKGYREQEQEQQRTEHSEHKSLNRKRISNGKDTESWSRNRSRSSRG
jgi:hypothetical protein